MVFTSIDHVWDIDRINKYIAILDRIEASEGEGVMISIGTGPKIFSSGFDLKYWMTNFDNF